MPPVPRPFPIRRAATMLGIAAVLAFAAHAGVIAVAQQQARDSRPAAKARRAPVPPAIGAPRTGTTGTTPLPALPDHAVPGATDAGVTAAAPFRMRGSVASQARALHCLTTAIYYEAANEPDEGQRAVAQVVLNRVRHPAFPPSVCGVVFQGSGGRVCQFSFACDGAMARVPGMTAWARARAVASRALAGDVFAPVGLATHYHTYAVTPSWNRSLVMTGVWGAHFFHRWKGWWGTAAAFGDRYTGVEPLPGPLPAQTVAGLPLPLPPVAASAPVPSPPSAPAPAAPPTDAAAPTSDPQLPDSQIRERWRDSGTPVR